MADAEAVDARVVEITFINGESRSYAFEPLNEEDNADSHAIREALDRFTESGYLLLESESDLTYIPLSSILSLKVAPKPLQGIEGATRILFEL